MIGQSDTAVSILSADIGEIDSPTLITMTCGNYDTAIAEADSDYTNLIANDVAERLVGYAYWWQGHGYFIPSIPEATNGYFLKIATVGTAHPGLGAGVPETPDAYTYVRVKCGVGAETIQEVTIKGVLQPVTVYVPNNDPCELESVKNADGQIHNVSLIRLELVLNVYMNFIFVLCFTELVLVLFLK